jgi:hypothetical protein
MLTEPIMTEQLLVLPAVMLVKHQKASVWILIGTAGDWLSCSIRSEIAVISDISPLRTRSVASSLFSLTSCCRS